MRAGRLMSGQSGFSLGTAATPSRRLWTSGMAQMMCSSRCERTMATYTSSGIAPGKTNGVWSPSEGCNPIKATRAKQATNWHPLWLRAGSSADGQTDAESTRLRYSSSSRLAGIMVRRMQDRRRH